MVKYHSLLPTRKITKILCPCCITRRRTSTTFKDADQKPRRTYRVTKMWTLLFIPLSIIYTVFYNYRYQSDWHIPKEHRTHKEIISAVDVMIRHDHEAQETSTMRLLSLDDLDLKRKEIDIENSPFIVTSYDHPKALAATAKSSIVERNATCSYNHTGFGRVPINITILSLQWVDRQYPMVGHGGYYRPPDCRPRYKVAILVPYMNREETLASFLFNIHPFLISQKTEYRIFVIEQYGQAKTPLSKGRLYNAGFSEAQKLSRWECFIFHEVALLPLDSRILYTCPTWPRHMSASVTTRDPSRWSLFGGVTALSSEQFIKVNGYSNYRNLGEEDYDMFWRLRHAGFSISRYNKSIAQYTELKHNSTKDPLRNRRTLRPRQHKKDGLSELNYTTIKIEAHHLYTRVLVDINLMKEQPAPQKRRQITTRN